MQHIDGVDYRHNIFIFLSNTGGRDITRETYRFWTEGRRREDISYTDLEMLVNRGAFNELGGQFSTASSDSKAY